MTKRSDLFARISLDYMDHPKIAVLSGDAIALHLSLILWSRKYETDGRIPARIAMQHAARFSSDSLGDSPSHRQADAKPWPETPLEELAQNDPDEPSLRREPNGDYIIHGYDEMQETSREIAERRARNRENGRRGGIAKAQRLANAKQVAKQTASDSLGDSVSNSPSKSGSENVAETETETDKEESLRTLAQNEFAPPRNRTTYPPEFETFWAEYPLKRDKGKALKAWKRARTITDADTILNGAKRYAQDPNRDPAYTKYAEGWLNGHGWNDEPLPPRNTTTHQPERLTFGQQKNHDLNKLVARYWDTPNNTNTHELEWGHQ